MARGHYFDIIEDGYIAETTEMNHRFLQVLAKEHEDMLYTPLPPHLPTITKDPLILMAAYEGNLDRYVRLRRPKMLDCQAEAVIRGIYHNTTFCSLQNFSRDELEAEPRWELWKLAQRQFVTSAKQPVRSYYTDYLERREAEEKERTARAGAPPDLLTAVRESRRPPYYGPSTIGHDLCEAAAIVDKEPTTTLLLPETGLFWEQQDEDSVYARGYRRSLVRWELYICAKEQMRQKAREEDGFLVFKEDDYPWSLYPRHCHAQAAREYKERVKRESNMQQHKSVDVDSI